MLQTMVFPNRRGGVAPPANYPRYTSNSPQIDGQIDVHANAY